MRIGVCLRDTPGRVRARPLLLRPAARRDGAQRSVPLSRGEDGVPQHEAARLRRAVRLQGGEAEAGHRHREHRASRHERSGPRSLRTRIVVGVDQCIDVAAWFARNRTRPALAGWTAGSTQTLRVAVRYRECPSDPSPAPRDPCGCDNNGCEFGRVREVFELALFTAGETVCAGDGVPSPAAVLAVLEGSGPSGAAGDPAAVIKKGLDTLMASGCPVPSDEVWLCLAAFDVQLDATPVPVNISDPDNTIPERRTLLPTHALQAIVLGLAADSASAGMLASGPRAGALSFTASATDPTKAGDLAVAVLLVKKGSPAVAYRLRTAPSTRRRRKSRSSTEASGRMSRRPPQASRTTRRRRPFGLSSRRISTSRSRSCSRSNRRRRSRRWTRTDRRCPPSPGVSGSCSTPQGPWRSIRRSDGRRSP